MERRDFLKLSAAATLTLAVEPTWAQTAKTEIHWLGQATTKKIGRASCRERV